MIQTLLFNIKICFFLFSFFVLFFQNSFAQSNQIDSSFNPLISTGNLSSGLGGFALQPDGKIIIYKVEIVNGVVRPDLARLNQDGTLDNSFNCTFCSVFKTISGVVVQPDGKILVSGANGNNNEFPKIYRLNSDGSYDPSYVVTLSVPNGAFRSVRIVLASASGKSYMFSTTSGSGLSNSFLARLNNDGSIDTTFRTVFFNIVGLFMLKELSDGKLLVAGSSFLRFNADGTIDTTFEAPTITFNFQPLLPPSIVSFDLQADGKYILVGRFSEVNNINKFGIVRLNADLSVDLTFNPKLLFPQFTLPSFQKVRVLADQKILVQGNFANASFYRLNPDGTIDSTFPANFPNWGSWELDSLNRIIYYQNLTYRRLNADFTPDTTFISPEFSGFGKVKTVAVQNDQKTLISGEFGKINNSVSNKFARLNADGTLDTSFNSGSGPNEIISVIRIQKDGKILIGGTLSSYNGTPVQNIARLNSDGSLDNSFNVTLNGIVNTIALQSDGKILISGGFTTVNGSTVSPIVRLNSDGSLDNSFSVILNSGGIAAILVESDGKIIVGGSFSGISGFARANIARLNVSGSVDSTFNAGTVDPVYDIIRQPDSKYLIKTNQIKRLNSNGSADTSFQTTIVGGNLSEIKIYDFKLLPNGAILIGGSFETVNNVVRKNIARLKPDGTVDRLTLANGTDNKVFSMSLQTDGKVVVGGDFKLIENEFHSGIARILNLPLASITKFDFDGDGRADIGVFRPSNSIWYQLLGSNYNFNWTNYGLAGDILTPADYDGDGKTDISIFRPSTGQWVYGTQQVVVGWGQNGDVPLPSDVNGDGKSDFVVFRPSNRTWYRITNGGGVYTSVEFGAVGDQPLIGDFDGDGKADPSVFRPSTGEWFYASSSQGGIFLRAAQWGLAGDKLVPADYDGDGKTDAAIYRDGLWAIYNSSNGSNTILTFGQAGDKPVAADYDGDGKADVGVYRPSDGTWYLFRSTSGFQALAFGASADLPIPSAFVQ